MSRCFMARGINACKLWLMKNSMWKLKDGNNVTFLDGGHGQIPPERVAEFLQVYSRTCQLQATFLVEKPDKSIASTGGLGFRFVMDLDFKMEKGATIDDDAMKQMVERIDFHVRAFFPNQESPLYVCTSDTKTCESYTKVGIHLIWQTFYVSDPVALCVRHKVVQLLDTPPPEGCVMPSLMHKSWDDVIDAKIYDGSGMRALYAHKASAAKKDCRQQKHPHKCDVCDGWGHLLEGRPYHIKTVLNGALPVNVFECIANTSILSPQKHSVVNSKLLSETAALTCTSKNKRKLVNLSISTTPRGNTFAEHSSCTDNKVHKLISDSVQRLNTCVRITGVKNVGPGSYVVLVDSKDCGIKQSEHNSNHIYYSVDHSQGIRQRCFSSSCEGKFIQHAMCALCANVLKSEAASTYSFVIPGV